MAGENSEATLVREIERLLGAALDEAAWTKLGRALKALHTRFVAEVSPEGSGRYFEERTAIAAYLSYFFPASEAQVRRALAEVPPPEGKSWRVLDVGSGPGPASFAVADWAAGAGAQVDVTALEGCAPALETMQRLWPASAGPLKARVWTVGAALPDGPFDVIVLSHTLNELYAGDPNRLEKRQKLVDDLATRLAPGGYLVLVDPALRRTGRELLVVRDRLVAAGMIARAPCLLQSACPAIVRPRDWCHADRPWTAPPLVERAADAAGLARESLKYSYVVLSRTGEKPRDAALFRIVSEPLPEKGKLRYFGCGPAGRHALTRLDKDRAPENAVFDTLERGDVVRIDGLTPTGDGRRLGSASRIEIVTSAAERDRR